MATTGNYINAGPGRDNVIQQSALGAFADIVAESAAKKQALELEAKKADAEFQRNLKYRDLLNAAEDAKSGAYRDNSEIGRATVNVANPTYAGTKIIKSPTLPANGMMSLIGGGYGDVMGNQIPQTPTQELGQTAMDMAPKVQSDPRYSMEFNGTKFGIQDNRKEQYALRLKAAEMGIDSDGMNNATIIKSMAQKKSETTEKEKRLQNQNIANQSTRIRQEFINRPEVKEFITASNYTKVMEDTLNDYINSGKKESRVALDQALISPFNKLLDPTSVTMISEYARTNNDLSLYSKFVGGLEKLQKGGAGLTDDDRFALVKAAKIIQAARANTYNQTLDEYTSLADQLGLDSNIVTRGMKRFETGGSEQSFASEAEAEAANLPSGTVVIINGRRAQVN